MEAGEGAFWVSERKFNCQRNKYDALAHKAFKNVKITAITVGYVIDMKTGYPRKAGQLGVGHVR